MTEHLPTEDDRLRCLFCAVGVAHTDEDHRYEVEVVQPTDLGSARALAIAVDHGLPVPRSQRRADPC